MGSLATAFVRVRPSAGGFAAELAAALLPARRTAAKAGEATGASWRRATYRGAAAAGAVLATIGVAAVKSAIDFNAAMRKIQTQAGGSARDVRVLSKAVLHLALYAEQGPKELADALFHLKSVGLDNVHAMRALKVASDLAAVGGSNLEDTTNALAGAWRSGIKGAQDFQKAAGTLNAIVGAGNLKMQDLVAAIGTGFLVTAKQFGISLTSIGAALATLTDQGVPAQKAATRLRIGISLLGAPSAKATKELNRIGLSGTALAKAMRGPQGLLGAIKLLKNHLDASGLSAVQQAQLLSRAFGGGRSSTAILALVNNVGLLEKKQHQINKTMGRFPSLVAAQRKTAAAQFAILKSSIQVLGIKLGNFLLPIVIKVVHAFTHMEVLLPVIIGLMTILIGKIIAAGVAFAVSHPLITAIALAIVGLVFLTVVLVKHWRGLVNWFKSAWPIIDKILLFTLTPVWLLIHGIMFLIKNFHYLVTAAKAVWHAMIAGWNLVVKAWDALVGVVSRAFSAAWRAIVRAWDALVGVVSRVFNAIKGAIVRGFDRWWATHGDEVKRIWHAVWSTVLKVFHFFWDPIVGAVKVSVSAITHAFGNVAHAGSNMWHPVVVASKILGHVFANIGHAAANVWHAITVAGLAVWHVILFAAKVFWKAFLGLFWAAVAVWRAVWAVVKAVFKAVWDAIVGIFNTVLALLTGHWSRAWHEMLRAGGQIWNAIKGAVRGVVAAVASWFNRMGGWIRSIWNHLWKWVHDRFRTFGNVFKGLVHGVTAGIPQFFVKAGGWIRSIWDHLWKWVHDRFVTFASVLRHVISASVGWFSHSFNNVGHWIRSIWDHLWKWVHDRFVTFANVMRRVIRTVVGWFSHIFTLFGGWIRSIWDHLWKWAHDRFTTFGNVLRRIIHAALSWWSHLFNNFGHWIRSIWDHLWKWAHDRWNAFSGAIGRAVRHGVNTVILQPFKNLGKWLRSIWDHLWKWVHDRARTAMHVLPSVINKIKGIFSTPIKWVANNIFRPLANLWNAFDNKVLGGHLPHLPTSFGFKFAQGGVVPGVGRGDKVPSLLEPGERVLSNKQVAGLGGHGAIDAMLGGRGPRAGHITEAGLPGYKSGGIAGFFSSAWDWVKNALGHAVKFLVGIVPGPIRGAIKNVIRFVGGGAVHAAQNVLHKVVNGIFGKNNHGWKAFVKGGTLNIIDWVVKQLTGLVQANVAGGPVVAAYAKKYAHGRQHPYVLGGANPRGWDCSGFTAWVYKHFGIWSGTQGTRHGTSESQWRESDLKPSGPVPGALAFFQGSGFAPPGHVGIVTDPGHYVSAYDTAEGTVLKPIHGSAGKVFGFRVPKRGFGTAGALGGAQTKNAVKGWFSWRNAQIIYSFLRGNGYSHIAASAVLGNIARESGWNPEAVGTGGGGLIGWTPMSAAFPRKPIVTGRPGRDMATQLVDLLAWNRRFTSLRKLNTYRNIANATAYYMNTAERPGIPALGERISWAKRVASRFKFANGGVITEPIVGMGLRSGHAYQFGERGDEIVIPKSRARKTGAGATVVYNVNVSVMPGTERQVGKTIVDYIRKFEQGSGKGWRS